METQLTLTTNTGGCVCVCGVCVCVFCFLCQQNNTGVWCTTTDDTRDDTRTNVVKSDKMSVQSPVRWLLLSDDLPGLVCSFGGLPLLLLLVAAMLCFENKQTTIVRDKSTVHNSRVRRRMHTILCCSDKDYGPYKYSKKGSLPRFLMSSSWPLSSPRLLSGNKSM